jgi:hypothetical protein
MEVTTVSQEPHTHHDEPVHVQPHTHAPEPGNSMTTFAIIKYGFILAITIVILYFLARFIIPLFD